MSEFVQQNVAQQPGRCLNELIRSALAGHRNRKCNKIKRVSGFDLTVPEYRLLQELCDRSGQRPYKILSDAIVALAKKINKMEEKCELQNTSNKP